MSFAASTSFSYKPARSASWAISRLNACRQRVAASSSASSACERCRWIAKPSCRAMARATARSSSEKVQRLTKVRHELADQCPIDDQRNEGHRTNVLGEDRCLQRGVRGPRWRCPEWRWASASASSFFHGECPATAARYSGDRPCQATNCMVPLASNSRIEERSQLSAVSMAARAAAWMASAEPARCSCSLNS